mgnify:CR=1 FL=1
MRIEIVTKFFSQNLILQINVGPVSRNLRLSYIFKEIQIILRLFLVIAMYCQASSSQIKSIIQPPTLLASWEGSLGTCKGSNLL